MTWRVCVTVLDGANEMDLLVDVADTTTTVGLLGRELGLGEHITVDGRPVDADLPITAAGMVSGAVLARADAAPSVAPGLTPLVTLHQIGGLSAGGSIDLTAGRHAVGAVGPSRSELQIGTVPSARFVLDVTASGEVTLESSSTDLVMVDGIPVTQVRAIRPDHIINARSALFRVGPFRQVARRFGDADGSIGMELPALAPTPEPAEFVTPPDVEAMRKRERAALHQSSHPVHATFRAELAEAHHRAIQRVRQQWVDVADLRHGATIGRRDLWSRSPQVPLQLGYADPPWSQPFTPGSRSPQELSGVVSRFARLPSVPIGTDLAQTGQLTLTGPRHAALAVARWILLQSATRTDPASMAIRVATNTPAQWDWAKWLPHCAASGSAVELIVLDGGTVSATPVGTTRMVVRIVSELDSMRINGPVTRVEDDGHLSVDGVDGLATGVGEPTARQWARALAPLQLPRAAVDDEPSALSLEDVCGLHDEPSNDIAIRWRTTAGTASQRAPFGGSARGLVAADFVASPHLVVSGPAGAGRSAALRTLLLSLAINHAPDSIDIIAIDAGAEGTFVDMGDLPHVKSTTAGLGDSKTIDILNRLVVEMLRPRPTFVFIDDATTLAAAVPEAGAALSHLGQRRTGGLHLILATRRPEGLFAANLLPAGAAHLVLGTITPTDAQLVFGSNADAPLTSGQPGEGLWSARGEPPIIVQVALPSFQPTATPTIVQAQAFVSAAQLITRDRTTSGTSTPSALIAALTDATRRSRVAEPADT